RPRRSTSPQQFPASTTSPIMTERTGHYPDPADPEGLRLAVTHQGIALGRQAESLNQMAAAQQDLFRRLDGISLALTDLTSRGPTDATASNTAHENIRLLPEPFLGDVGACGGFLLQCRLIFQQAPRHYHADHTFLAAHPITHLPFDRFLGEFRLVFDQPRKQEEATRRLLSLKQGNRPVSEHLIDFRILAVEAGWPDPPRSRRSSPSRRFPLKISTSLLSPSLPEEGSPVNLTFRLNHLILTVVSSLIPGSSIWVIPELLFET
uniref:Retrotransposon gag domain-containing protein n=1 Tax=Oryzias latipes TaxID=8090 RepID=A0A3P9LYD6_ORYLA